MIEISTGSTLTPIFSSHLIAALMSARLPSSSRLTIPISSVTLAWRMLVVTSNLHVNCQINGSLMSFGGYISQRRVCWFAVASTFDASGFFAADFFFVAMMINGCLAFDYGVV